MSNFSQLNKNLTFFEQFCLVFLKRNHRIFVLFDETTWERRCRHSFSDENVFLCLNLTSCRNLLNDFLKFTSWTYKLHIFNYLINQQKPIVCDFSCEHSIRPLVCGVDAGITQKLVLYFPVIFPISWLCSLLTQCQKY